jgi:hypothetical protein
MAKLRLQEVDSENLPNNNPTIYLFSDFCIIAYSIKNNTYEVFCAKNMISVPPSAVSLTLDSQSIFICGGSNSDKALIYDPKKKEHRKLNPMAYPKIWHSMIKVDNAVYVVGGFSNDDTLKVVEKFDLVYEEWSRVADTPMGMFSVALAVVGNNQKIIMAGG